MKTRNFAIKIAIALVFIGLCASVLTYVEMLTSTGAPQRGIVGIAVAASSNLGVYSDSACTQVLTSLDWGTVVPGESWWKTIYVRNEGNVQTTLSMTTTNWSPASANGPLSLTWNRQGTVLAPSQVTAAELKFSVSSGISGITSFGMDVVFSGN